VRGAGGGEGEGNQEGVEVLCGVCTAAEETSKVGLKGCKASQRGRLDSERGWGVGIVCWHTRGGRSESIHHGLASLG
jgi:hypothetical protein